MLVNIELVSWGSPDSRTTRTAAATASVTPPSSSPDGAMLNATIMAPRYWADLWPGRQPEKTW